MSTVLMWALPLAWLGGFASCLALGAWHAGNALDDEMTGEKKCSHPQSDVLDYSTFGGRSVFRCRACGDESPAPFNNPLNN